MAWGEAIEHMLKENIALFILLGKEHKKPAENPLLLDFREYKMSFSKQLTIKRERDLIDTFAFLFILFNESDKVIAIYIKK